MDINVNYKTEECSHEFKYVLQAKSLKQYSHFSHRSITSHKKTIPYQYTLSEQQKVNVLWEIPAKFPAVGDPHTTTIIISFNCLQLNRHLESCVPFACTSKVQKNHRAKVFTNKKVNIRFKVPEIEFPLTTLLYRVRAYPQVSSS